MKKRFLSMAAALALALALALPCAAEDAGFSFRSIDVKAEVHADNTITVTETYTLNGAPNGMWYVTPEQLAELLAYERSGANREEFTGMLTRRISKIADITPGSDGAS